MDEETKRLALILTNIEIAVGADTKLDILAAAIRARSTAD